MDDRDTPSIKKLMRLFEQEGKRRYAKDLQTALLYRVNRQHYQDVNVEFFNCLEDVRQVKSGVLIYLNDPNKTLADTEKTDGGKIITAITKVLGTSIERPIPKIDSTGKKYQFKDGSESRFEDYEQVKVTVREDVLFDIIIKLNNLFSEGLAFLGIQDKNIWHRVDMIEEIDPADLEKTTEAQ